MVRVWTRSWREWEGSSVLLHPHEALVLLPVLVCQVYETKLVLLVPCMPFFCRVSFEFQHNVCGRSVYAQGAVDAVLFLHQQVGLLRRPYYCIHQSVCASLEAPFGELFVHQPVMPRAVLFCSATLPLQASCQLVLSCRGTASAPTPLCFEAALTVHLAAIPNCSNASLSFP